MSDYYAGVNAGRNQASWDSWDVDKKIINERNNLIHEYNALVERYQVMTEYQEGFSATRNATRQLAISLAEGKQPLLTPPVDRGAQSRVNYTVLMMLKEHQPKEYNWLLNDAQSDQEGLEMYGLG